MTQAQSKPQIIGPIPKWLKIFKNGQIIDYKDVTGLSSQQLSLIFDMERTLDHICCLTIIPPPPKFQPKWLSEEEDKEPSFFTSMTWAILTYAVLGLIAWGVWWKVWG